MSYAAVDTYLSYVNDHDVERALACLAPDFTLEFAGSDYAMTRAQTRNALEWDAGTNGRLVWDIAEEAGRTVTVEGTEGNEFLDLIGVGRLAFRSVFTVQSSGLISHQLHHPSWGDTSMEDALAPLIEWATEHAASELAEIYPDGHMVYSGEMAGRWLALARRWHAG